MQKVRTMAKNNGNTIHWFRKCLRLHDNPALVDAVKNGDTFYPIFILDPWFVTNMRIGTNRWRFLVQSLEDLDASFRKLNMRLFVLRGKPAKVLPEAVRRWNVRRLTFEGDTEQYSKMRDEEIESLMMGLDVEVVKFMTNLLYDPEEIIACNGKVPLTYQSFVSSAGKIGLPPKPVLSVQMLHNLLEERNNVPLIQKEHDKLYGVPTFEEVGLNPSQLNTCLYPGGETEALLRLDRSVQDEKYICNFAKPDTSPNSIKPSTTVLSPYVRFGCLSARTFYYKLREIYLRSKKGYTKPPVSLHGQLFWREFFYTYAAATPNFDQIKGNSLCMQIPWTENKEFLAAWENARTGYPFIDAIMTQLRDEGWVHHLARHAVACFLTRGDLWVSWEHGMRVFEELLLDADLSINAGNWLWLSCSAFFHQYFRVYSPIAFGKKTDKRGEYIRKYVPILKRYPPEFIYEPWKAPKKLQEQLGCVIGRDYPMPIVDHDKVRVENIRKMEAVYRAKRESIINQQGKTLSPSKSNLKRNSKGGHSSKQSKLLKK